MVIRASKTPPACFEDLLFWVIAVYRTLCKRLGYLHTYCTYARVTQIPMRARLRTSNEHRLFEAHKLGSPPQWNYQRHIGTGGFAKVYLETITRPVFGTHLCAVKRILKGDVKFPRKSYEREIEIFSKLKQVSTPLRQSPNFYISMIWGSVQYIPGL